MKVNYNGELIDAADAQFGIENRAFRYGDGLFETIRFQNGKLLFWEDHYYRMMGGMCLLRMDIPIHWNMEYIEEELMSLVEANGATPAMRVRLSVFRNDGGLYTPEDRGGQFIAECVALEEETYQWSDEQMEIDVFYDHRKGVSDISNAKTTNCLIYTLAGIYRKENALDDAILINVDNKLLESVSSNLFLIKDDVLLTPPLSDGCVEGVMRKQIIKLAEEMGKKLEEKSLTSFDMTKADEVFLTNVITGIRPVTNYKKKEYETYQTEALWTALCAKLA